MKIESGKTYRDRSGAEWEITNNPGGYPYVFKGSRVGANKGLQRSYTREGRYYSDDTSGADLIEEVKATPAPTPPVPHKFCDVMVAYAQDTSLVVQWRRAGTGHGWKDCDGNPHWDLENEYRIKPKEVELTVFTQAQRLTGDRVTVKSLNVTQQVQDNLSLTFDPSGTLIRATVLR